MGYFSNGYEGMEYEIEYCNRCVHGSPEGEGLHECAVLELHFLHNYEECNKPDSFLHTLIPRDGIRNKQCRMFIDQQAERSG